VYENYGDSTATERINVEENTKLFKSKYIATDAFRYLQLKYFPHVN
jgi:hypothetical protein